MKKLLYILALVFLPMLEIQAQQILTDHDWYIAGEKMTIAVEVNNAEATSKVAYIELSDIEGMKANAVIALSEGRGQGNIYLPSSLHSGYYQLSMYTRMDKEALQMLIPVVNTLQKSYADDIDWVQGEGSYKPELNSSLLPAEYLTSFSRRAENEGHCVYARIRRLSDVDYGKVFQVDASLAVVGKEAHVFQGKMLDDSTAVFNTFDVDGRHSIVINAETYNAQPLQVEVLDPFANILPKQLPHLTFKYNREEVEKRSVEMQMAAADTMVVDSTVLSHEIFSTQPMLSYNLDEYRQFRTIREVLLEYVNFVHRSMKNGRNRLFVYNDEEGYSDWPALVLLDGMPVKDINRLLEYDARRVHYISMFDDYYTFGDIIYKGIINIVTRTGKLTNFPPEKTSAYIIYDFPQRN